MDAFTARIIGLAVLFASLVLGTEAFGADYPAQFHSCYDGDTCKLDIVVDEHTKVDLGVLVYTRVTLPQAKIRLCDIDTPEIRGVDAPTKQRALDARDWLVGRLQSARKVEVRFPLKKRCMGAPGFDCVKRDKYGRLLGYLIADGVNLNGALVMEGHAVLSKASCL